MPQGKGAPDGTGSRASTEPQGRLGRSGFDPSRAVQICMEQAGRQYARAEEIRKTQGAAHIGVLVWGERGAACYGCAVAIATVFDLPAPVFAGEESAS